MWGLGKDNVEYKGQVLVMPEMDVEETTENNPAEPDVLTDISVVKVDEFFRKVKNLNAYLAVIARNGDYLKVLVGADVPIEKIKIEIEGMRADAYLKAHLGRVKTIINKTFETLYRNPEILTYQLIPVAEGEYVNPGHNFRQSIRIRTAHSKVNTNLSHAGPYIAHAINRRNVLSGFHAIAHRAYVRSHSFSETTE